MTRWLDRLPEGRFALVVGAPGLLLVGVFVVLLPRYLGESASPPFNVLAARIVLTVAPCIVLVTLFRTRSSRSADRCRRATGPTPASTGE